MRVRSNRTLILQSNQTLRRELHFLLNSYYLIKYMSITFLTIKVVKAIKPYIQTKCNYWITRAERTKQYISPVTNGSSNPIIYYLELNSTSFMTRSEHRDAIVYTGNCSVTWKGVQLYRKVSCHVESCSVMWNVDQSCGTLISRVEKCYVTWKVVLSYGTLICHVESCSVVWNVVHLCGSCSVRWKVVQS